MQFSPSNYPQKKVKEGEQHVILDRYSSYYIAYEGMEGNTIIAKVI